MFCTLSPKWSNTIIILHLVAVFILIIHLLFLLFILRCLVKSSSFSYSLVAHTARCALHEAATTKKLHYPIIVGENDGL